MRKEKGASTFLGRPRQVILVVGLAICAGCPGRGGPPPDRDRLDALLQSPEATAYASLKSQAGGDALGDWDRAILGHLWLQEGETVRAISDLHGVNPRALDKFERRILYLMRGAVYYSRGWLSLAEKEFLEADRIELVPKEVNIEGENTEPILITDLLARGGLALVTPDRGLPTLDLGPLEETAALVGDRHVLSFVRAEIARRTGEREGLDAALEDLLEPATGEARAGIEAAVADLKADKEADLEVLTRPELLVQIGHHVLDPVLAGTKVARKVGETPGKAAEVHEKVKAPPPPPKPEGGEPDGE